MILALRGKMLSKTGGRSSNPVMMLPMVLLALSLTGQTVCLAAPNYDKLYNEAQVLMNRGSYKDARVILKRIVEANPRDARALTALGVTHINSDENNQSLSRGFPLAMDCFQKATTYDPKNEEAWARLADCTNINGDYVKSLQYAEKGIALNRSNPHILSLRAKAVALSSLHRDKEALPVVEQLIKTGYKPIDSLFMKAACLENIGDYKGAMAVYQQAEKISKTDTVIYHQISCLEHLGQRTEAIKLLDKILASNPEDDAALHKRAKLKVTAGDLKGALSDYSLAIKSLPTTSLLNERANLYDRLGRADLAKKDREKALQD